MKKIKKVIILINIEVVREQCLQALRKVYRSGCPSETRFYFISYFTLP
jgi:hypothetical protein